MPGFRGRAAWPRQKSGFAGLDRNELGSGRGDASSEALPAKNSSKKAQKSDPIGGRFLKEAREGRYRRRETLGAVSLLEISREMSILLERD